MLEVWYATQTIIAKKYNNIININIQQIQL